MFDNLCCLPVWLLWFGPLALIVFCASYTGCKRLLRLVRPRSRGV